MFKVTLHSGELKNVSLHNMLGRLDFGYAKLGAVADYKAELLSCGFGSHGVFRLESYPRWSASIWDLIARLVAMGLHKKVALPDVPLARSGAYATRMCAQVEHWADGEQTRRALVGTAQLTMTSARCIYTCELQDDLTGTRTSERFRHAPEVLLHWDLLARAVAWTDAKSPQLAPTPALRLPTPFKEGSKTYVGLSHLVEPALSGLKNWLMREGHVLARPDHAPDGMVPEDLFVKFLSKAL